MRTGTAHVHQLGLDCDPRVRHVDAPGIRAVMTRHPLEDHAGVARPIPTASTRQPAYTPEAPPPSRPARFIPRQPDPPPTTQDDDETASTTYSTTTTAIATGVDAESYDVADALGPPKSKLHFRETSGNAKKAKYKEYEPADEEIDELLANASSTAHDHIYPPTTPTFKRLWSDISTRSHPGHTPVPAIEVFSRQAPSLSLPELDEYISALPIPDFAKHPPNGPGNKPREFVPMDRLTASGKQVADLIMNGEVAPAWRNRSSIAGVIVSLVLDFMV